MTQSPLKKNQEILKKKSIWGTSLVVQWLRHFTSNAGVAGLIPDWGTKIPTCCMLGPKEFFK